MKHLFSILAVMAIACLPTFALPTSTVSIRHNGVTQTFSPEDLQKAVDMAEEGDTILLSEGSFPGFTIRKPLTLRGSGEKTYVRSGIYVSIPNKPVLRNTLLEGMHVGSNIGIDYPVEGFKISQCRVDDGMFQNSKSENYHIDRCIIKGSFHSYNLGRGVISNSKVYNLYNDYETDAGVTMVNCDIYDFSRFNNYRGTIMNSVVSAVSEATFYSCTLINNLIDNRITIGDSAYAENCLQGDYSELVNEDLELTENALKALESGEIIGNDGNTIGAAGGQNPFTLKVAVPKVKDASMKLSPSGETLDVEVHIIPE